MAPTSKCAFLNILLLLLSSSSILLLLLLLLLLLFTLSIHRPFQNYRIIIQHIESRKAKKGSSLDFFIAFEGIRDDVSNLMKVLKQNSVVNDIRVLTEEDVTEKGRR